MAVRLTTFNTILQTEVASEAISLFADEIE